MHLPHAEKPLTLGTLTLKNRLAKSAMSERIATSDGAPSEGHVRLYDRWAQGGAGLIITGNVMIDRRALGEPDNVIIEDDRDLASLKAWARASQRDGARSFVQLNHPGRQSPRTVSSRPVAPSAVPVRGMFGLFAKPAALSEPEIEDILDRFARAASIVRAAGFDGVQIHGAHGYLVSQFLSPLTNLRHDDWGGSPERRRRFVVELVRRTRAAVGRDFPVAIKLNSADFQRGGFDEAESMDVVSALEAEGIDLLEISGGTYEATAMFAEPGASSNRTRAREAFFLDYATKVRARTRLPLMVTGGFRSAEGIEAALASGAVDIAGLARPLCDEPDLPARLLSGEVDRAKAPPPRLGIKKLDVPIEMARYQMQLKRLADGSLPAARISHLRAFLHYAVPRKATYAPAADAKPDAGGWRPRTTQSVDARA